jgi:hypothetical protein
MKILFLATYFPRPLNPTIGTWALEQAKALKRASTEEQLRLAGRELRVTSGDQSAGGAHATSNPPPVTAPEVPGFFVRLGNSDPIIHNESPKRDYSRMDFYGRRNDVLFHSQNTPMPDLLWQLPKTIVGGLFCAAKVGRWRKMLEGFGAGFVAIAGGAKRRPVSNLALANFRQLKAACLRCSPQLL